ncbi:MAG: PHP domain-containing protein [Oscillospiraceae bacterium]|nr:PHP domain-containing protein [Oscillospiraceae bacterium]
MTKTEKLALLNADTEAMRLEHLATLLQAEAAPPEQLPQFANNHIHTTYSFSPYSPTAAVYFAREAGLQTAGIMDHDSIGGAKEFRRAGELAEIGTTCGIECRVNLDDTALAGRKLNNPDQAGICYMAIHSVMPDKIDYVQAVFAPLREKRNVRNRAMVARINEITAPFGITINFEQDVLPCSKYHEGGTVTERHLLWALAGKVITTCGAKGVAALLEKLGITPSAAQASRLTSSNPDLQYDLLGIFKAHLVARFYIPATEECMRLKELVQVAEEAGAILCYPYLGDVGESVTGDKKREQFEDSFLDELFEVVYAEGVRGITYMPSRNTEAQIARLRALCTQYHMVEISGEDINTPAQSFICEKLADPGFAHLVEATWMLIEREKERK